jgi:hypothetical protein
MREWRCRMLRIEQLEVERRFWIDSVIVVVHWARATNAGLEIL